MRRVAVPGLCSSKIILLLPLMLAALEPTGAQGQTGAVSTRISTSARSAGMGTAGVAVFWGDDPVDWANPALLGAKRGLRYEWSRQDLLPGLADVHFTANRIVLGAGGLAVGLGGDPVDALGGYRLDYGVSQMTDANGDPIGTSHAFEDINAVAVGLNVLEGAEQLLRLSGASRLPLSRFGDISLGHNWKRVKLALDSAPTDVKTRDRGVLLRVTPYNAVDYPGVFPGLERALRVRIDWAYGWSKLDYDGSPFTEGGIAGRIYGDRIEGYSVHAAVTPSPAAWGLDVSDSPGWLIRSLTPLVSFGITRESSQEYSGAFQYGQNRVHKGWEVTLANILSVRQGHIDDPGSFIHDDTSGWGLGFQYRDLVRVQYDHASLPQPPPLTDRINPDGFSVRMNPLSLWKRVHR